MDELDAGLPTGLPVVLTKRDLSHLGLRRLLSHRVSSCTLNWRKRELVACQFVGLRVDARGKWERTRGN
jgi:hypothetical protein